MISANKPSIPKIEFDRLVIIDPRVYDIDLGQFVQYFVQTAEETGIKLVGQPEKIKLPKNIYNASAKAADELLTALSAFSIKLEKKKYVSPKAQHRWKKTISTIEFHIKHEGATGTVVWQKSNEMRLFAGAKMLTEEAAPRRKDGTLGLPAKFTANLRDENAAKWNHETYVTIEDIILRSVNEVGHFLYFAGTNSWLEMIDDQGRTIHELTVVQ